MFSINRFKTIFLLISLYVLTHLAADQTDWQQHDPLHLSIKKSQEFVSFTMPKTGTHLLQPLLEKFTGKQEIWSEAIFPQVYIRDINVMMDLLSKPNVLPLHFLQPPVERRALINALNNLQNKHQFLATHAPYTPEMESILLKRNCIVFYVIRDPRDYVISLINHRGASGADVIVDRWFKELNMSQKIRHTIVGTAWYNSTRTVCDKFMPWRNSPVCCVLRFEKLVGPHGGSCTKEEQIAELRKIANALNLKVTDKYLLRIFNESFGTGSTFRTGTTGNWKKYFSEEDKTLFKQLLGDVLIELGYEKDYNW